MMRGQLSKRSNGFEGNDDHTQAGNRFRLMSPDQASQLIGNIASAMKTLPREIHKRQIGHFYKADPAYGEGVATGLGAPAPKAA